jgi:hypothetical protein
VVDHNLRQYENNVRREAKYKFTLYNLANVFFFLYILYIFFFIKIVFFLKIIFFNF